MRLKFSFELAVVLSCYALAAQAACLRIDRRVVGDNTVYSVFLHDLTAADQVTALSVSLLPGTGRFENYNSSGFGPGPDFEQLDVSANASFTNAELLLPPNAPFFGRGWGIIDGSPEVAPPSGPDGIGYAASDPGHFLEADGLLLNNVMLPTNTPGSVLVVLIGGDGNPIPGGRLLAPCIPEPSVLALATLCIGGLICGRRG